MRPCILLLTLAAFTFHSISSEEEFASWGDVDVSTEMLNGPGKVRFVAKAEGQVIKSVAISAFGKEVRLDDKQIGLLKDFPLSSLSITHEAGYEQLGGHTVHFKFRRMIYDGQKKPIEERLIISLPKTKDVQIFKDGKLVGGN